MTAEISHEPWAALYELLGVEEVGAAEETIGPVAFYGRCSTEDNQDPETSHGWQLSNAQKFVEPLGATVVAEFFDIGQSRSVPWERREAAGRLLSALKNPAARLGRLVVGEGTRCWFGNQFSLIGREGVADRVFLAARVAGHRGAPPSRGLAERIYALSEGTSGRHTTMRSWRSCGRSPGSVWPRVRVSWTWAWSALSLLSRVSVVRCRSLTRCAELTTRPGVHVTSAHGRYAGRLGSHGSDRRPGGGAERGPVGRDFVPAG